MSEPSREPAISAGQSQYCSSMKLSKEKQEYVSLPGFLMMDGHREGMPGG